MERRSSKKESVSSSGILLVLTGPSGSGKDTIMDRLVESGICEQIVTTASRSPREGEVHGKTYWFTSVEEMKRMEQEGLLAEELTQTGTSYKATTKAELLRVIEEGKNLIWRIDLSRAGEIAEGGYFERFFEPDLAYKLKGMTKVVFIDVDREELEQRRRQRDGDKYNPDEYLERDSQELKIIERYKEHFIHKVVNKSGMVEETVEIVRSIVFGSE